VKFVYEYRTGDNVRHEGVVVASDREAAFRQLREQGIRPGKVAEAPGFFNKLFGRYKRWLAIVLLLVLSAGLLFAFLSGRRQIELAEQSAESPLMRRQVYGDPALMEELARSSYATVFDTEADRFLACYAQPASVHRFDGKLSSRPIRRKVIAEALDGLVRSGYLPPIEIKPDDSREAAELKRIVLWMREELRSYLANGLGTTASYVQRLDERLAEEVALYQRIKNELSRSDDDAEWEKGNATLRAIGAPTIPRPENKSENSPLTDSQKL